MEESWRQSVVPIHRAGRKAPLRLFESECEQIGPQLFRIADTFPPRGATSRANFADCRQDLVTGVTLVNDEGNVGRNPTRDAKCGRVPTG